MRLADFEALVRRLSSEVPPEFLEGVAEITVSPRTVRHPDREGVWTLGECIPLPGADADPRTLQSRVVLYHGSFQALANETEGFDWQEEAWETLTHEIRHHIEWKARAEHLENFDKAAEANFARQDGGGFDPAFYRDGVQLSDGSYQVDDDVFIERVVSGSNPPSSVRIHWRGSDFELNVPPEATLPAYLTIAGIRPALPGDLVVVLQKKSGWLGVFARAQVFQAKVEARPALQ